MEKSSREFAAYRLLHAALLGARPFHAELRDQERLGLLHHEFTHHALQVPERPLTCCLSSRETSSAPPHSMNKGAVVIRSALGLGRLQAELACWELLHSVRHT